MKSLQPQFARMFAAGLVSASLIAPLAASAAPALLTQVKQIDAMVFLSPEQFIRNKATALGSGFTGSAVSGLETVPGGYRIRYQYCDIYYSSATGAHEVHGDIRAKYNAKGGPSSDLALPTTDEMITPDGIGRYNHFSGNGSIYWTPDTGPMEVRGGIRWTWANQGWENGPLGYPTTDERVVGTSKWYSDFQNGVLYWEGNAQKATEDAGLSRAQMINAVRNFFEARKGDSDLKIHNVSIPAVSNTGYGFWQSRNRLVTFRIEGEYENGIFFIPNPDYQMELRLLFFSKKESDGSTSLWVALDHWYIHTSGIGSGDLLDGLKSKILQIFAAPIKLSDQHIPAFANVLSFKVLKDGGIKIYLQPGNLVGLARLLLQNQLDAMAD